MDSERHIDANAKDLRPHVEQYAQIFLKAAFLLNGAAAGASVALIGAVWEANATQMISLLVWSLERFVQGLIFAAVSSFSAFWSMYSFYQEKQEHSYRRHEWGDFWHGVTLGSVIASYGAFVVGVLVFVYGIEAL